MDWTEEEKAKQLMNMFDGDIKCTLICVDEIIEALEYNRRQNQDCINFYKEVKKEIFIK